MHSDSDSAKTNEPSMGTEDHVAEIGKPVTNAAPDVVPLGKRCRVGKIPDEVLKDIFLGIPYTENIFSLSEGPWPLTRVSSRWYDVAAHTPGLWTTIKFNLDDISSSARQMEGSVELLALVLERSAGRKLCVDFTAREAPPKCSQPFLDVLRSTRQNWVELSLQGMVALGCQGKKGEMFGGLRLFPDAASGDTAGFDSLKKVIITDLVPYERRREFVTALEKAPNLRIIIVNGLEQARRPHDPPPVFSWGKLTHVSLGWTCLAEDWGIRALKECVGLHTLLLEGNPGRAPSSRYDTLIELRTVKILRVQHHFRYTNLPDDDFPPNVCHILKLPALEELDISNPMCGLIDVEMHVGLLERSQPPKFRTISLHDVTLTDITLGRILRAAPQVTTFTMNGYVFPHVVNMIASGEVLPNIEKLSIGLTEFPMSPPALLHATRLSIVQLLEAKTTERLSSLQSLHIKDKAFDMKLEFPKGEPVSSDILQEVRARVGPEDKLMTGKIFVKLVKHLVFQDLDPACRLLNDNIELFEFMLTTMEDCETDEFKSVFFEQCSIPELLERSYMFWSFAYPCHAPSVAKGWKSIKARFESLDERWRA
ncbi:hypothetical protein PM082_021650 [Marasmius tenuissimus]|nr:hypothetical protein PM082_021650 [Marasmius tenuissimus]